MFTHASALLLSVVAFSSLVAATPGSVARGSGPNCSDGSSMQQTYECTLRSQNNPETISFLGGLFDVVLNIGDTGGLLGLACSPISVTGIGSGAICNSELVCCTGPGYQALNGTTLDTDYINL